VRGGGGSLASGGAGGVRRAGGVDVGARHAHVAGSAVDEERESWAEEVDDEHHRVGQQRPRPREQEGRGHRPAEAERHVLEQRVERRLRPRRLCEHDLGGDERVQDGHQQHEGRVVVRAADVLPCVREGDDATRCGAVARDHRDRRRKHVKKSKEGVEAEAITRPRERRARKQERVSGTERQRPSETPNPGSIPPKQ
ncbi:hypothetical protein CAUPRSCDRAFT_10788, partial [Caulochytrium protostelioides]